MWIKRKQRVREKSWFSGLGLTLMFTFIVFVILLLSIFIAVLILLVLSYLGLYTPPPADQENAASGWLLAYFATVSILVSIVASLIFSRIPLSPIREVIHASEELAKGHFDVRIQIKGPKELRKLNQSFNHMAEELGSLELLRADFINNFSHEFKTPIVSIRGYAKMLKKKSLTPAEREEYLDIILNESQRLSELATNVLSLSRIEHQLILSGMTTFNLTEQLRSVIVLLEPKWSVKDIEFDFDAAERNIQGNADLLHQVWINLLDNAIKFSPDYAEIQIELCHTNNMVHVDITNHGPKIASEQQPYIFDKFYQGDTSHSTPGNGLGLSIAHRIVTLHDGTIQLVQSNLTGTTFRVTLPSSLPSHL